MKYIIFNRVSTISQSNENGGSGLLAQQDINERFVAKEDGEVIASFDEVISGATPIEQRPVMKKALALAKKEKATILCARLDRLSRKVSVIATLQDKGVPFKIVALPDATTFTINIYASLAQQSRDDIADKTKIAMDLKRKNGQKFGLAHPSRTDHQAVSAAGVRGNKSAADKFALHLKPVIDGLKMSGFRNTVQLAKALNNGNYKTARGSSFAPTTVRNILKRLEVLAVNA